MAVDAVLSEPLSRPNSLLSGKNTGIFLDFGFSALLEILQPPRIQAFYRSKSQSGATWNRDLSLMYQGITFPCNRLRLIAQTRRVENYFPFAVIRPEPRNLESLVSALFGE
jgi:hypothetical protein